MIIEVLTTPDCSSCKTLEKMLDEMDMKYELVDVTKQTEYLEKYPIFTAPGLVVDGKLAFTGIPKKDRLKEILSFR